MGGGVDAGVEGADCSADQARNSERLSRGLLSGEGCKNEKIVEER
jgi:hypothetical protein